MQSGVPKLGSLAARAVSLADMYGVDDLPEVLLAAIVVAHLGHLPYSMAMEIAAQHDYVPLFKHSLDRANEVNVRKWWDGALKVDLVESNAVRCVMYLHQRVKLPLDESFTLIAAQFDAYECLMYAISAGTPWHRDVIETAASNGAYRALRYAYDKGAPRPSSSVGSLICAALWGGSRECLRFILENEKSSCPRAAEATIEAILRGQFETLKFLLENGVPLHSKAACWAARYGSLAMLMYVHKNGAPLDPQTAETAAKAGSLDCLKYACEQGAPLTELVAINAARAGSLECLKFALENGAPLHSVALREARMFHYTECLEYIRKHGAGETPPK